MSGSNPVPEVALNVYQGDTYFHSFTWQNADGTPVDLTGYSARMQVRDKAGGTTIIFEVDDVGGGITLGGTAGTVDIELPSIETAKISKNSFYDLELTDPSGKVNTLVRGPVYLFIETTK